jgi:hypothetical protein
VWFVSFVVFEDEDENDDEEESASKPFAVFHKL